MDCDEKGITMARLTGKQQVVVRASTRRPALVPGSNRRFVSVLETISADNKIFVTYFFFIAYTDCKDYTPIRCLDRKNTLARHVWMGWTS